MVRAISLLCAFTLFVGSTLATTPSRGVKPPVAFVENVGQCVYTDGAPASTVAATVFLGGVTGYISPSGISMVYSKHSTQRDEQDVLNVWQDVLRVDRHYLNGNPNARVEMLNRADGTMRYINGATGLKGAEARRYTTIILHDVWNGIDVRLSVGERGLKEDFIVHAGADPSNIAVQYQGASDVKLADNSVVMSTLFGSYRESAPVSFTTSRSTRYIQTTTELSGRTVRYRVADYDKTSTLVVDPDQEWATYFGFNNAMFDLRIAADKDGNMIASGSTAATNLPRSPGVVQNRVAANTDGFVAKFSDAGKFLWCTYFGGSGGEQFHGLDTDAEGNIWTCGSTSSRDLPVALNDLGAIQGSAPLGDPDSLEATDALVVALTKNGVWLDSWLVYGRRVDVARGISVRPGSIVTVGSSNSSRLGGQFGAPYTKDPANSFDNVDAWVHQVKPRNNVPNRWDNQWISFYGKDRNDVATDVRYDKDGGILITGTTYSTAFDVTDGSTHAGQGDVFVLKFNNANPGARVFATLFGSSAVDDVHDMEIDGTGDIVIVGQTTGTNFPTVNAFKATKGGILDGWARKINGTNGTARFSTYIGGDSNDIAYGVAIDASNRIWIAGSTGQSALPVTTDAFQAAPNTNPPYGNTDGFLYQFTSNGQTVLYCSYYGAPAQANLPPIPGPQDPPIEPDVDFGQDYIHDIATDRDAYLLIATSATTLRMDTTDGAYQDSSQLDQDTIRANAFYSYFSDCPDSVVAITSQGPPAICDNNSVTLVAPINYAQYLWNTGDTTRVVTVSDTGQYVVMCRTAEGCRFRDTITITRNPKPIVSAGADTNACVNTLVRLTATPSGGTPPYRYKWRRIEPGPSFIDDDTLRQPGVNPNTTSSYTVTLTDSAGCEAIDTVRVTIINPQPTSTTTLIDFGEFDACETRREQQIRIQSSESYPITIDSIVTDGPQIEIVTPLDPPIQIGAGGSALITVAASPQVVGTTTGKIITRGGPCGWRLEIPYTMTRANLVATITPSVVNFPTGASCTDVEQDSAVVIRNGGTDTLTVQPGVVAAPFTIVTPLGVSKIAPGETLRVEVRFAPSVDGNFIEEARFAYQAGSCADTLKASLRGSRSSIDVSATQTTIDFGTLEGCDSERDTTVTFTNNSSVDVTIELPSSSDVVFNPAGPITIPANSTSVVTVTIRPASSGAFVANPIAVAQPCDVQIPFQLSAIKNGIAFTTPSQIQLGKLNRCTDPSSTTQSYSISFDGTGSATVSTIATGPTIATTLTAGTMLQSGTPQSFDVTWTPTADGLLVDSIVVVFSPCDVRRVIRLTGSRVTPRLRALTPTIALGGFGVPQLGTARFENNGTDSLLVNLTNTTNVVVVARNPAAGVRLLPGEILSVDYRVECVALVADTITATSNDACAVTASTVFTGSCDNTLPPATANVVIDSIAVKTGDEFVLPMRLVSSENLDENNAQEWEAEITYNPMVVIGRGATPDCFVDNQYTPCTITIQGVRQNGTESGLLANLNFTAILGTDGGTNVVISNFTWLNTTNITTTTRDGYVMLTDICEEGGVRLLRPKAAPFSIRVYPTPASTELTLDVQGLGSQPGTWTLSNYVGQQLDSDVITPDADGNSLVSINVAGYSNGTYFLTIDARGTITRTTVLIQR